MSFDTGDGHIQVPADSVGKKVDATEIIRQDTGVTVERQRFEARDEDDNVLSTKEIADLLRETNQLLFQMLLILRTENPLTEGSLDG